EARPGVGELVNPQAQRGLVARLAAPIPRGATELREATGPHATNLEGHLEPPGELPTAHRPQAFFRKASDSMCLSSVRSATSRFSRLFRPRVAAGGAAHSRPGVRTFSSRRRTWLR